MKIKNILIVLFSLLSLTAWSQAPLNFSARLNVIGVTGSDPYTLTGVIQDDLSLWSASDLNVTQDSIYHLEGSTLQVYRIVSITSAVGNNFVIIVDDINNSGILPSTGTEWAALKFTTNYQFPVEVGNLATNFKASIDNRFKQRLDTNLFNGISDYVTTDSFSTFQGGLTFASIPIGKTVWRTTTGSRFRKSSATSMVRVSTDNGLLATTILNVSNDSLLTTVFNSNLNNRVLLSTGNVTNAYIQDPKFYTQQAIGETFVIGIQAGSSDVTINWTNVYGIYNGSAFATMPTTVVPAQTVMNFSFRVITGSAEIIKFQWTDGTGISTGASQEYTFTQTSHGKTVGQIITIASISGVPLLSNGDVDTLYGMGIITQVLDANNFKAQFNGTATITAHGKTKGLPYYVDDIAGGVTTDTTGLNYPCIAYEVIDANRLALRFQCLQLENNTFLNPLTVPDGNTALNAVKNNAPVSIKVGDIVKRTDLNNYASKANPVFNAPVRTSSVTLTSSGNTVQWDIGNYETANFHLTATHSLILKGTIKKNVRYVLTTTQNSTGGNMLLMPGNIEVNGAPGTASGDKNVYEFFSPDGTLLIGEITVISSTSAQQLINTYRDSNLVLAFIPSEVQNASKGRYSSSDVVNPAFKAGDRLGAYVERGPEAWSLSTSGQTGDDYPILHMDGTRCAVLYADPNNVAGYGTRATSNLYNLQIDGGKWLTDMSDGVFTFDFQIRSYDDAGSSDIFGISTSASQYGVWILKEASTRFIRFRLFDGDGTAACDVTSTNGLLVSDGWQNIRIRGNGTNVVIELKGVSTSGSITTFTAPSAGLQTNPFIGYHNNGNTWRGLIGNFWFFDKYVGTATLTTLEAHAATTFNTNSKNIIPSASFDKDKVNNQWVWYDFSNTTGKFQDVTEATAVTTNGQPIYVARSTSPGNPTIRNHKDLTAASAGQVGTYVTGVSPTGLSAMQMSGTDLFSFGTSSGEACSDFTVVWVGRADTSGVRKTLFSDNTFNYWTMTSSTSVTNSGNLRVGEVHVKGEFNDDVNYNNINGNAGICMRANKDSFNVVVLTKLDSTWCINVNGNGWDCATRTGATNTSSHIVNYLGSTGRPFIGYVGEFGVYKAALGNSVVDSLIRTLGTKWGVNVNNPTKEYPARKIVWSSKNYYNKYNMMPLGHMQSDGKALVAWKSGYGHNRLSNNNEMLISAKFDENGVMSDTFVLVRDAPGSSYIDLTQGGYFRNITDSTLLVVGIKVGDSWNESQGTTGTDSLLAWFRTVNIRAKTRGAITEIAHPNHTGWSGKFFATDAWIDGSNWYVCGYSSAPGSSYTASIIKSTNSGSSWTVVMNLPGSTWNYTDPTGTPRSGTNAKPEEIKLLRLQDGRYMLTIRCDEDLAGTPNKDWGTYVLFTTNLDSWNTATLRQVSELGINMPQARQLADGTIVIVNRKDINNHYGATMETVVLASYDNGLTFENRGTLDLERKNLFAYENFGSSVYQFASGRVYAIVSHGDRNWNGRVADLTMFDITSMVLKN